MWGLYKSQQDLQQGMSELVQSDHLIFVQNCSWF